MVEKVTKMLVKVDLQCWRCRKKIKKILCKIPQIRDQIYDEKRKAVQITVVCCSPEKIRDKIICKGGETVLSVEILPEKPRPSPLPLPPPPQPLTDPGTTSDSDPSPPTSPDRPQAKEAKKPKVVIVEPPKEPCKPAPTPAPALALAPALATAPAPTPKAPKAPEPAPQPPKPAPALLPPKAPGYPPVPMPMPMPMYPMVCCCPCYEGYGGGPCYYHGQGRPVMCYDGCGRQAYESQGGHRGYSVSRCDYLSEENATGCTVM